MLVRCGGPEPSTSTGFHRSMYGTMILCMIIITIWWSWRGEGGSVDCRVNIISGRDKQLIPHRGRHDYTQEFTQYTQLYAFVVLRNTQWDTTTLHKAIPKAIQALYPRVYHDFTQDFTQYTGGARSQDYTQRVPRNTPALPYTLPSVTHPVSTSSDIQIMIQIQMQTRQQ